MSSWRNSYLAKPKKKWMNWEQLLSLKRYGDKNKRLRKEQDETRLGFDVDYDRVIFSSEFRSLQDKTQVIPLSQTDFVHTRLTHSLEVSVVGRSLGRKVGQRVLQNHPYLKDVHGYNLNDFGAIVAAAALAHDIGNPPFGHSGEKAIGEYFKTGNGRQFQAELTEKQYQDLCDFEGNANGFKILTENKPWREGGLRLSYATLGAFMKYPKESLPKKPTNHISDKKYGFFQSEKFNFENLASELNLIKRGTIGNMSYCRHPLAYLVEAADDICYTLIDFEDGINLGLIQEEFALEYLIKLVKDSIITSTYNKLQTTKDRLSYLRALAINTLINESVEIFMNYEAEILDGSFSKSLMECSRFKAQTKDIIKLSVSNIYQSENVLDKEIIGYKVLNELLDIYVSAVINSAKNKATVYNSLVLKTLKNQVNLDLDNTYQLLLSVCQYVSKMSDTNAITTFKKLNGNLID